MDWYFRTAMDQMKGLELGKPPRLFVSTAYKNALYFIGIYLNGIPDSQI